MGLGGGKTSISLSIGVLTMNWDSIWAERIIIVEGFLLQ